ncbi:MAG: hypothetical protein JRN45_01575 [Nitrososphaerota archaeon]|nr:hypothetical protein [Nitrososphaerota archaeon]
MSTENSDLYEVTCLDCNTTKSYFTAQGASYFRLNHRGHKIKAKEPGATEQPKREEPVAPPQTVETTERPAQEAEAPVEEPVEVPVRVRVKEPLPEPHEPMEVQYEAPASQVLAEDRVRLGNLVVDVVDEGTGRAVKMFGIANGRERFTKSFDITKINEVNGFLESGVFCDDSGKVTYTWTPDKVDLSIDVATMIDNPSNAPEAGPEPIAAEPKVEAAEEPKQEIQPKREAPVAKAPPQAVPAAPAPARTSPLPEDVLLGKRSYVQEGEEFAQECVRVSKVLKKFRWNTEPPYVIGAMFDDLMCVQSQNGMIKSSLVEEVKKLGYAFVAIEAPGGIVSAWFKKSEADEQTEVLGFHQ